MRDDYLFGAIALREGFITEDQLRACLAPDPPRPLRDTLRARGWLTEDRIQAILDIQNVRMAEADPSPESGGLGAIGPYAPLQEAGRGSMAVVFKALHRPTNRIVALKILRRSVSFHPALVQRFEREARVAARLRHPHIARVLDTGVADGLPYIALEYIEGATLRRVLREGRLRLRTVLEALRKSALAVQHAHESGVIHRDLKPANIVLDAAGDPHLMDFGLARIDGSEPAFVRPGAPLGTPFYMPPEQSRGDLAATDARSDVYALGVILYETLAGRVPFSGPTAMAVFRKALSIEPLRPSAVHPAIPPELDALCLKALARGKEDRFPSAAALAGELRRILEARPGFDPPLPRHPPCPPLEMESTG